MLTRMSELKPGMRILCGLDNSGNFQFTIVSAKVVNNDEVVTFTHRGSTHTKFFHQFTDLREDA